MFVRGDQIPGEGLYGGGVVARHAALTVGPTAELVRATYALGRRSGPA
ncbi:MULTISPECIES: hypothetical protein [unclassified Streptomyces]